MALTGIELSAGIVVGVSDPLDIKYGPYADIATAKSEVASNLRHKGLTVGVIEAGSVVEYWWKDNITDLGLVQKTSGGGGSALTVRDDATSVTEVSQITFVGAVVSEDAPGLTTVTIEAGGAVDSVNTQTGVVVLDTSDIADTLNKRYVTDANLTVLGNTSGTNTGDQNLSGLVPYTGATANVNLGEFQLSTGQVTFDQTPTGAAGVGVLRWNDADGTLDLGLKGGNVTLQVGQEEVVRVVNGTGGDLLEENYQAVKIIGVQGQRLKVDLALADSDVNSATTIGIVTENISNNQEGFITASGVVRGINTTGTLQGEDWSDGDVLYLSPTTPGSLTKIKPLTPYHLIVVGFVEYAHAVNGKIYVKVDNGYELAELHDVLITSVADNDLLQYNSTDGYWENKTLAEAGIQPAGSYATAAQGALADSSVQPGDNISDLSNDANYIPSDITGVAGANKVANIISLTQAQYDEIVPDEFTIYNITDAPPPPTGLQAVVDDLTPELGGDLDASDQQIINLSRINGIPTSTIIEGAALGATATQPGDNVSTLNNDAGYTSMIVDTVYTDLVIPEAITFSDLPTVVTQIFKRNISADNEIIITSLKDYSRQLLKLKSTGNGYLITFSGVIPRSGVAAVIDDSVADLIHIIEFFGDGTYDYNLQEA